MVAAQWYLWKGWQEDGIKKGNGLKGLFKGQLHKQQKKNRLNFIKIKHFSASEDTIKR